MTDTNGHIEQPATTPEKEWGILMSECVHPEEIFLTKDEEKDIERLLLELEANITPMIATIHRKYPSIIVGLNTRYRSNRHVWDKEKGGEVQATFVDFNSMVSPDVIVWH